MIFLDSSYLIALADRRDQWHRKAMKLKDKLDRKMIISDLVMSETVTVIGKRAGGKAGRKLYDFFTDSCEVVYADERLLAESMETFLKYDGKLSLADALSVVIMKRKKMAKIASFDSDFDRVRGINRVG